MTKGLRPLILDGFQRPVLDVIGFHRLWLNFVRRIELFLSM
jgi:hypothetical protein